MLHFRPYFLLVYMEKEKVLSYTKQLQILDACASVCPSSFIWFSSSSSSFVSVCTYGLFYVMRSNLLIPIVVVLSRYIFCFGLFFFFIVVVVVSHMNDSIFLKTNPLATIILCSFLHNNKKKRWMLSLSM